MRTAGAFVSALVLAGAVFTSAPRAQPPEAGIRTYEARRAAQELTIDGHLEEAAWHRVVMTEHFTNIFHPELPEPSATQVKALYDDDHLYFSLRARDTDIWATKTERDQPLWEEEVLEVYLDPDGDGRDYAEFEINALGTIIDLLIPQAGDQRNWEKCAQWNCQGLETGVRVFGTVDDPTDRDRGWTAEMAIPRAALPGMPAAPLGPGDELRVQFFRIERTR
ncbi:MAG: carbohydrate-binding family 9-like protein, partial [Armatimonadota bacterium]